MASRNRVTERDRGWNRIQGELRKAHGASVKVGLQQDAGDYDDPENQGAGPPLAAIAFWNEYGTSDGRIPSRPAFRIALDENREIIETRKAQLLDAIYAGRVDVRRALAILGLMHENQIKGAITELQDPPNAAATIENKGSSNPLIDTGQTRQSIRYEVDL